MNLLQLQSYEPVLQEDKKAETEKAKQTKKMDVDKRVEEVESASGEKMVRAAHVPVPSQVRFFVISSSRANQNRTP